MPAEAKNADLASAFDTLLETGILDSFFEALPTAFYTTDTVGRITAWNSLAARLWGRAPTDDDRWSGAHRILNPDGVEIDRGHGPLASAVRAKEPMGTVPVIFEQPDGTRVHVASQPSPLVDRNGTLVGGVDVLVDMTGTLALEERAHRLAAVVDSSDDAIISKTLDGVITSWNGAAERLFGYRADEIIGQSVLKLIPEDLHYQEDEILAALRRGERIEHFETLRCAKDGRKIDVSLTISPIYSDDGRIIGASKIGRDISGKKQSEARLEQQARELAVLSRLSADLVGDLEFDRIVQKVTDAATQASGAAYGAFFYRATDDDGEGYMLYALSGASKSEFERFGMPRATAIFGPTFEGRSTIVSADIRQDPRYGHNAPHKGMPEGHLPVVSYLATPVRLPSGEVLGGLFFGHPEEARFDDGTVRLIENIAAQAAVALDNARLHENALREIAQRKEAEEANELLLHELKHRVKNTLATIQAIASQTLRSSPKEEMRNFLERLRALAGANDIMTSKDWQEVPIAELVRNALRPFADPLEDRFDLELSDRKISAAQSLSLALAFHELATNAVKYGALSTPDGRVSVCIEVEGEQAAVVWTERGGPPVIEPERRGFGTMMIDRALSRANAKKAIEFCPDGVVCRLVLEVTG